MGSLGSYLCLEGHASRAAYGFSGSSARWADLQLRDSAGIRPDLPTYVVRCGNTLVHFLTTFQGAHRGTGP